MPGGEAERKRIRLIEHHQYLLVPAAAILAWFVGQYSVDVLSKRRFLGLYSGCFFSPDTE